MKQWSHYGFLICVVTVLIPGCAPAVKYTYERGRPQVYDAEHIKRVAVLFFGHDEFTDSFIEKLVNRSKWSVIARADLERIVEEQNLQHTDRFDVDTAVQLGKLAGVDLVVFGEYREETVKAIDVQTGKYLVYRNIRCDVYTKVGNTMMRDHDFNSALAVTALLPYTIKYREYKYGRLPKEVWCGSTADHAQE